MKLRTKLLISFLFASIVPIGAVSYYTLGKVEAGFKEKERQILESVRHDRANSINHYYQRIVTQIEEVADNPAAIDAMKAFSAAFSGLQSADLFASASDIEQSRQKRVTALNTFYQNQFVPKLSDDIKNKINLQGLVPQSDSALKLQYAYLANNPHPVGNKNALVRSDENARYHDVHGKYHDYFNRIIEIYGYYDIFLVEAETGEVVYSVYKEIDFATSLITGPHADSGLAQAYKSAIKSTNKASPAVTDYQKYIPSYNAAASFISKPIHDNKKLVGVLIFQLPVTRMNDSVNDRTGLGKTGKAYLVGSNDGLLRTQLPSVGENTVLTPIPVVEEIENTIAAGGYSQYNDHLGHQVESAVSEIDILGQNWRLVVEQDSIEAFKELSKIRTAYLYALAISLFTAISVALWLLRNIRKQLGAEPDILDQIALEIAEGDLSRDFTGLAERFGILKTMVSMQQILKTRDAADRKTMENISQLRDGLQKLTTPVALASSDHKIMFINTALEQTLQQFDTDIHTAVPDFDSSRIHQSTIAQFSDNPQELSTSLDALTGVHEREFIAGSRIFKLVFNAMYSVNNERIGTSMEWQDITDERRVMEEVDAVVRGANKGKLADRIDLTGKSGVNLGLSKGINGLLDVNQEFVTDVNEFLAAISAGDLTSTIDRDYQGAFAEVKKDANKTVQKLMSVVTDIRSVASTVDEAAQKINAGNSDLSGRTERAAASLQETSVSMKEMTESVAHTAANSKQAKDLAQAAKVFAEKGGEVVGQAVLSMEQINNSSQKVVDIIDVIDDIAFQTNLLALNASVEAARAGEQGRGFAVVASEVRNLASRSASAAKQIKELIEDSVKQVECGAEQVNESGRSLEDIVAQVGKVTNVISEISASCQEQSEGIALVNCTISQLDDATQQNAALVVQGSAASQSTTDQAANLIRLIEFFSTTSTLTAATATANQVKLEAVG